MHNNYLKVFIIPHPHSPVDDRKKERRDYDSRKLQYFSFQDGC